MIQMPRLVTRNMTPGETLHPIAYSLRDNLAPLSEATLTLPHDAPEVPLRAFVELFTADGSAGIFRVVNRRSAGLSTTDLMLQHGLCTLSDHMHPGESEETGSCRTLLTKLLSNQTRWVLGTVDVPDDEDLTWSCNNTNDLQGLTAIMKELPGYYLDFDQSALPWVLHVRKKSDTISCEARIDRNLVDVQVEYDTSEMCNVAYADGLEAPIVADNVDDWDRIERHVSTNDGLPEKAIQKIVGQFLEQHKDPRVTITLTAMKLSRLTGEPFDSFRKGQLCRCILDDTTAVQRIVVIERPDPIGSPDEVVLTLASTQNDLSVTVAGLVLDTLHVNQLQQIHMKTTKTEIDGISTRVSTAEILLNEVIGELELRVSYNDFNNTMNEVSLTLSAQEGAINAKADLVRVEAIETYIQGLLKVDDLEAQISLIDALTVTSVSAADIFSNVFEGGSYYGELVDVGDVNCGSLIVGGSDATWKSTTVVTGIGTISQDKRYLTLMTADGGAVSLDVVTNVSISPNRTTINYLGKA